MNSKPTCDESGGLFTLCTLYNKKYQYAVNFTLSKLLWLMVTSKTCWDTETFVLAFITGVLWAKRGEHGILRTFRASLKMPCSPSLAHKASVMQDSCEVLTLTLAVTLLYDASSLSCGKLKGIFWSDSWPHFTSIHITFPHCCIILCPTPFPTLFLYRVGIHFRARIGILRYQEPSNRLLQVP